MTTEDSGPSIAPAPLTDSGSSGAAVAGNNIESDNNVDNDGNINKPENPSDTLSSQRVFKKSSHNNKLTLYLSSRDLVVSAGRIDRLQGVLMVDPEFVENRKVYGQVTLTFRYGREDEEVMGLKFCNEAIMCLTQLYPPHEGSPVPENTTPLQDALVKRLGPNAYPFNMEITPLAPPSVQLVPAKEYNGAPIGTSYDVRAYIADKTDEKLQKRTTVRMGIRVVQRAFAPPSPYLYVPGGVGKTCKDRAKHNRKILLFGCKSAPLVEKFANDTQNKSRSVETVGTSQTGPATTTTLTTTTLEKQITSEDSPRPVHVSFKDHLTNGMETTTTTAEDDNNGNETKHPNGEEHSHPGVALNEPPDKQASIPGDEEANLQTAENENDLAEQYRSLCGGKRPSLAAYLAGIPPPRASVEKPFLLSDGKVCLSASLDKAIYSHGEEIHVNIQIQNNSNKTVKRIKVFVVQHVDVCMFSNGKFKNVVAMVNTKNDCPITAGGVLDKTFTLTPIKSSTKNWIALEDSYTKSGTSLASTVTTIANNPDERNVFAIYVSYYVKIKLVVSVMGGEVSLKLPFTLMHTCTEFEHMETLTRVATKNVQLDLKSTAPEDIKPEKDGT